MAKKSFSISSVAMAVLAIIAGLVILWDFNLAKWILGIFLIVWGILALLDKR